MDRPFVKDRKYIEGSKYSYDLHVGNGDTRLDLYYADEIVVQSHAFTAVWLEIAIDIIDMCNKWGVEIDIPGFTQNPQVISAWVEEDRK